MNGRIVVVTGATGGLGTAVVDVFLAAGDQVIGMARSKSEHTRDRYGHISADLSSSEAVDKAFNDVMSRYGRLDVVAHAMGGYAGGPQTWETDDAAWSKMMAMNVTSAFFVIRAALRHMTRERRGRIIAIGSRAAVVTAAGLSAYSASKAALNSVVETAALETKNLGITVNALLPSTIDTAANRSWGSAEQQAKWVTPESIAKQVLWLASDDASDISGALIPIYGRA